MLSRSVISRNEVHGAVYFVACSQYRLMRQIVVRPLS